MPDSSSHRSLAGAPPEPVHGLGRRDRIVWAIALTSLAVHIITAISSAGFHQFDEHFQILEFLNYQLGRSSADELAWEFQQQIRPWLQVWIYFWLHEFFELLGVTSPITHATLLRVFSALVGFASILSLWPLLQARIEQLAWRRIAWAILHLTWFIPYLHARTSSEALGGALLVMGFGLLMHAPDSQRPGRLALLAGLVLGLAVVIRVQIGVSVLALWLWMAIFRSDARLLLLSALAIASGLVLGLLADWAGYGSPVLSPWNYFLVNFIQDRASDFGVEPGWYYLTESLVEGVLPLSLLFVVASLWFWARNWRDAITWTTLPFVVVHSLIAHKELRFLFPVVQFVPLMLALWLHRTWPLVRTDARWPWRVLLAVNGALLLAVMLRAAHPAIGFYAHVWNRPEIRTIHYWGENPYTMLGLPLNFYRPDALRLIPLPALDSLPTRTDTYVAVDQARKALTIERNANCSRQFLSHPRWLLDFNVNDWLSRSRVWGLYRCRAIDDE